MTYERIDEKLDQAKTAIQPIVDELEVNTPAQKNLKVWLTDIVWRIERAESLSTYITEIGG